jgi:hypothetical protein
MLPGTMRITVGKNRIGAQYFAMLGMYLSLFTAPCLGNDFCEKAFALLVNRPVQAVKKVSQFVEGQSGPVFHFKNEDGLAKQTLRLAEDVANPSLRTLFPGLLNHLDSPTTAIFRKQWRKPNYDPSPEEKTILQKYGALELFEAKKDFMAKHPKWSATRKFLGDAFSVAAKAIWLLALNNTAQQLSGSKDCVDNEKYSTDPKCGPADDEVQLLVETVPFPHMAIRVGDRVYSYGVSHVQVTSASEYVLARELDEIIERQAPQGQNARDARSAIPKVLANWFKDQPRSIQVVTLKIGTEKRKEIKHFLEMQAWK